MPAQISVLLPVFNSEKYISESIKSVLTQTFEDFELIIINDGSTDDTRNEVLSFHDKRIVYIENETNQGIAASLNKGIFFSKAELIARMDSDDICMANRFEVQYNYMKVNPSVDIVGSDISIFHDSEDINGDISNNEDLSVIDNEQIRISLLKGNVLHHPTVMMRKNRLVDLKLQYDKKAIHAEDYKLWVDATLNNFTIEKIEKSLLNYRVHKERISFIKKEAQWKTLNNIRFAYSTIFFSKIISHSPFFYLSFLEGKKLNHFSKQDYKILADKLIKHNKKFSFFNPIHFEKFIMNLLFKTIS